MIEFRVIIDSARCDGCELCVAVCPKDVLAMTKSRGSNGTPVAEVVAPAECIGCQRCEETCPQSAIDVEPEDG